MTNQQKITIKSIIKLQQYLKQTKKKKFTLKSVAHIITIIQ